MATSRTTTTLILAAATAGILAGGTFAAFSAPGPAANNPAGQSTAPTAAATSHYSFMETSTPSRLIIPSISVNASVQAVGVTADGTMDVAHNYKDVGWYEYGPVPGAPGSAVIEGHLDTAVVPYAVFYNLDKVKPGDDVEIIDQKGRTLHFAVTAVKSYPYNAPTTDVFTSPNNGESFLNLVTCDGTWIEAKHIYDERLVVFTKRTN